MLPTLALCLLAGPVPDVTRTVVRRAGDDGVASYRIPGLAVTPAGTLVAVFDVRRKSAADLPGDIDVGVMRSTDNGATWGRMQLALDYDAADPGSKGNGVGDPAVVVDRRSGHVLVVALWAFGDRAWRGSGPGLSPAETGQLVLARSTDDGRTWAKPVNITRAVAGRDPAWRLFFNGPGAGTQLKDGALAFAAQYRAADGVPHACVLTSRDGGENWAVTPAAAPNTSEAQVAELTDGRLLLTMRDEARTGKRKWAAFDRTAGRWGEPWADLPDPTCMASLVARPDGTLVFANPASSRERKGLTLRTSSDGGRTWSAGRLLDPRPAAYSCLAVLADGSIGVLYECGDRSPYETLTFARVPAGWFDGR